MNKEKIMNLADAYATEVAHTPQMPTPVQRKLAVVKIGVARAVLEAALEQPVQRPWVGLTEFQFAEIYNKWNDTNGSTPWGLNQALEAKLKELNK